MEDETTRYSYIYKGLYSQEGCMYIYLDLEIIAVMFMQSYQTNKQITY